ncbi:MULTISPECIES: M24 family metallopeptidase [unclassified Streptomyces]|uniref:M24 family metallopeptidase n=1 Tax=unclassified Streptomyces TaxID=2593676 RepID=UPI0013A6A4E6|nr:MULTISPECIES: M24 family metallopeptidase [unclassified Streptomyces]
MVAPDRMDMRLRSLRLVEVQRMAMVRSGPHTVLSSSQEPPDRVIGEDDIVVVDLGPLLAGHETDFARTVVLGDDPGRHQLVEDLARVGVAAREAFLRDDGITGRQLHA